MKHLYACFACLLLVVAVVSHVFADNLAIILGSPTNDWRISRYQGATNDYTLADVDGAKVLSAGPNAIVLASLKPIPSDTEVTYRVRLAPKDTKSSATVYFYAGLKNADDPGNNPLFLVLTVPAGAEQETVTCQMPALQGAKERGKQALCLSNMRQIWLGLISYSDDNDGWFPMMYWGAPNMWDGYGNAVCWDYTGSSWMTHYFPSPEQPLVSGHGPEVD